MCVCVCVCVCFLTGHVRVCTCAPPGRSASPRSLHLPTPICVWCHINIYPSLRPLTDTNPLPIYCYRYYIYPSLHPLITDPKTNPLPSHPINTPTGRLLVRGRGPLHHAVREPPLPDGARRRLVVQPVPGACMEMSFICI